ncbi:MAG: hypothetical protein JSR18_15370 [Proteobacteria bacterium]|nr:hypothetical protein [Pseudomonadota bacterium]
MSAIVRYRWLRAAALVACATVATAAWAGPVERYRTGPQFCPRDRAPTAPRLSEKDIDARAIALLPDLCKPSVFVTGCDAEPELINEQWRVYVQQYKLRDGTPDHGGLDHSYVILDPVGNCIANIPGTPLGALH